MKKIIAAFVLFVGFSSTVSAQEIKTKNTQGKQKSTELKTKKVDLKELANNDSQALTNLLNLDQQLSKDLNALFVYKHEAMSQAKEAKDKEEISAVIEAKLRATLTPSQMEKVASQPNLLHQLTH